MSRQWFLLLVTLFILPAASHAREVAGVNMPEHVFLHGDKTQLHLNGAGIRTKFIFKIYVGGLYLPGRASSTSEVLSIPGPKRVRMHFLYDEVSKEKLIKGWQEGFENNLDADAYRKLAARLQQFNALFNDVHKGDEIDLDFLPGQGTQVWLNNKLQGRIEGEDFYKALLTVWLGKEPADDDLKQAMLGLE